MHSCSTHLWCNRNNLFLNAINMRCLQYLEKPNICSAFNKDSINLEYSIIKTDNIKYNLNAHGFLYIYCWCDRNWIVWQKIDLQSSIFSLNNKTIEPQKIVLLQSDQSLYYLPVYQHLSNTSAGCKNANVLSFWCGDKLCHYLGLVRR